MGDTVRLPNGKTMTRTRAQALGLLDEAGEPRTDLPMSAREEKAIQAAKRADEWRRSQGLAPVTTVDGVIRAPRAPEPLRPRNVDSNGETVLLKEVVDPETNEVIQVPVEEEGLGTGTPVEDAVLGTGTPVEEAATLPFGDARIGSDDDLTALGGAEDEDEDRVIPDSGLLAALAGLPSGDGHPNVQDDLGGADGAGD